MKDKFFLDTNIFVYSFDGKQPGKKDLSRELILAGIQSGLGVISTQVIQEFMNVATRKFASPMRMDDCHSYQLQILKPLCQVYPDFSLYETCLQIQAETRYSFYDSLIIAGALKGNCRILYSEDHEHNREIHGVLIQNPYR